MNDSLPPITTSVYTFEKLMQGSCLYVDKTEFIWNLIKVPCGIYFLSRPRRFGKSLTLSTLKAVFQGKRDLFQNLALADKPYEWKAFPVIHLDLGDRPAGTAEALDASLVSAVDEAAELLNLNLRASGSTERFRELIRTAAQRDKVVILVDEYDKPILDNFSSEHLGAIRRVLEDFYSVIKATEFFQRFVMLTGVSKFSKVSIFSKLNNLTDITMDASYAAMLGYTQEELENAFAPYLQEAAATHGTSREALLKRLKEWYNGYLFEESSPRVYNPVSIGKFFESGGKFKNYWFETGTPTFLIDLLKENDYDLRELDHLELDQLGFAAYEIGHLAPEPLLFQTGYLTIRGYDPEMDIYTLSYPNREVENAFLRYLADAFTPVRKELAASHLARLQRAVAKGDVDTFMAHMQVFFADVPNNITLKHEKYYQTIFHLVFRIIGINIDTEINTNRGRIDAVAKAKNHIFIFEFKLDGSAQDALAQIKEKDYPRKFLAQNKTVTLVGAAFNPKTRSLDHWIAEPLQP